MDNLKIEQINEAARLAIVAIQTGLLPAIVKANEAMDLFCEAAAKVDWKAVMDTDGAVGG